MRSATEEELRAQRRGLVASEAAFGSDADEAAYRAAHDRGDKEEMARLDAEGEDRRRRVLSAGVGEYRVQLHLLVPAALDARLREEALREHRTVTATVQMALEHYLSWREGGGV